MKRTVAAVALVCVCMFDPTRVRGDEGWDDLEQIPSCGTASVDHQLWQHGPGQLYVVGYAQTRRNLDGCLSKLRVEAWVEGVVMPTAISEDWGMGSSVYFGT